MAAARSSVCGAVARFVALGSARGFGHFLMRGPTGEAFVHEIDLDAEFFSYACGEPRGFFSHFAGGAVEIQRVADDDVPRAMLPRDFAEPADYVAAILALENSRGASGDAQLIRNRQADAPAAVIEAEHSPGKSGDGERGRCGFCGARFLRGSGIERCCHPFDYTRGAYGRKFQTFCRC